MDSQATESWWTGPADSLLSLTSNCHCHAPIKVSSFFQVPPVLSGSSFQSGFNSFKKKFGDENKVWSGEKAFERLLVAEFERLRTLRVLAFKDMIWYSFCKSEIQKSRNSQQEYQKYLEERLVYVQNEFSMSKIEGKNTLKVTERSKDFIVDLRPLFYIGSKFSLSTSSINLQSV